ncbi:MAG TPA: M56 family metallopeptidase [Candidatus Binatia bacterium]|jgi:Zn-dependent protease with chaperone function|nr:M56 family metallopeptidase [Candidatus Binatia bacterium]
MPKTLTAQLAPRQSAALWLMTMAALAVAAAAIASLSAAASTLAVWCHDFVVAASAGRAVAAVGIAAALGAAALVAAGNLAVFFAAEAAASVRLSRHLAARAVRMPARVLAAADPGVRCDVVEDRAQYAFSIGLLSPRVIVSTGLVSALTLSELRAVLAHEARHCRRRHPLRAVAWEALRRAFFFLPVLGDVAGHFSLSRELDADRAALLLAGGQRALASAMLKTVAAAPFALPSAAAAFGRLRPRIQALKGGAGTELRLSFARFAASAAAVAAIAGLNVAVGSNALAADGPSDLQCRTAEERHMTAMTFSPYFSILVPRTPQMSRNDAVQSVEVGP